MTNEINNILKAEAEGKTIFGIDKIILLIKNKKIDQIYITSNLPAELKQDLLEISKINDIKVIQLKYNNEELGTLCKKPFSIGVIGIAKSKIKKE